MNQPRQHQNLQQQHPRPHPHPQQKLTIVLLCSGNGSEPSHYRPSRDDVRYRHRHDALVRCVASSLFGQPAGGSHSGRRDGDDGYYYGGCELILMYDGDFSCMHMRLLPSSLSSSSNGVGVGSNPPLEKEIVSAWKSASREAIRFGQRPATLEDNNRQQHHITTTTKTTTTTTSSWQPGSKSTSTMGTISTLGRGRGNIGNITFTQQNSGEEQGSISKGNLANQIYPKLETKCVLDAWKNVTSCSTKNGGREPSMTSTLNHNTLDDTTNANTHNHHHQQKQQQQQKQRQKQQQQHVTTTVHTNMKKLPPQIPPSKRDILLTLQSTCPVDYLRMHHLNVPLEVALRKFNKKKLEIVWEGYSKSSNYANNGGGKKNDGVDADNGLVVDDGNSTNERRREDTHDGGSGSTGKDDALFSSDTATISSSTQWDQIERTFRSILTKTRPELEDKDRHDNNTDDSKKAYATDVMASYLHESCDAELPCWGWDFSSLKEHAHTANQRTPTKNGGRVKHMVIFLGAVRDMTTLEHRALSHACAHLQIPLVPCRLGPIPEFTSKILSVVGYHYHRGVLGEGLVGLWKRQMEKDARKESGNLVQDSPTDGHAAAITQNQQRRTLHTIAILPIDSHSLTANPSIRNRVHWCMVRLCVCSLWRSKLASSSSPEADGMTASATTTPLLDNIITFLFNDGVKITLQQKDFISTMAKKHKAAPSERQILEELCDLRDSNTDADDSCLDGAAGSSSRMERVCQEIILSAVKSQCHKNNHCKESKSPHCHVEGREVPANDVIHALDFTNFDENNGNENSSSSRQPPQLMDLAYSKESSNLQVNSSGEGSLTLFNILYVHPDIQTDNSMTKENQIHRTLRSAFSLANIQVKNQVPLCISKKRTSLTASCGNCTVAQDGEACTIILLQHLDYQSKLFPLLAGMGNTRLQSLTKTSDAEMHISKVVYLSTICNDDVDSVAKNMKTKERKTEKKRKQTVVSNKKKKKKKHKTSC